MNTKININNKLSNKTECNNPRRYTIAPQKKPVTFIT